MTVSQRLLEAFVRNAVEEDLGRGDLFARIAEPRPAFATIVAKSEGVFAGREYIETVEALYDIALEWKIADGEPFLPGQRLLEIEGDRRDLLSLERSILDFALHASGIATLTARYAARLKGYDCILLDTRKTRPGLRAFEKYAVRCGGGQNHRMGLDDALMLKDTHLRTIDDLEGFIKKIRRQIPFTAKIEVECEDLVTVRRAMEAGAEIIMCDNMSLEEMAEAVVLRDAEFPGVLIEASGNITLETIEAVAATGVDAISTGSIVHQAVWPDLSMRVEG